jgi:O-antigen/teichoic acid export membrane protein
MSYLKKGIKGITVMFIVSVISNLVGYFTRAVLARNLSPSEYGLFYAVLSVITFFMMATSLGLTAVLVKYIAQYKAKKDYEKIKFTFSFTYASRIIITIIISGILFIVSNLLAKYYFKNDGAIFVVNILAITMIFMVLNLLLKGTFNGMQNYIGMSLVEFFPKMLFPIFILFFVFLKFNKDASLPTLAFFVSTLVTSFIFIFPAIKQTEFFKHSIKGSVLLAKQMTSFGIASFFVGISHLIMGYTDTLILTYFLPLDQVGIYNVVLPTIMVLAFFGNSISNVLFPMTSELWSKKQKGRLKKGFYDLQKYALIIIVPASLIMFVFPKLIINLLFGSNYTEGYISMRVLSLSIIFLTVYVINQSVLMGIGKPKEASKILFRVALFNLISNFILIPFLGIIGAAITTTAGYILLSIFTFTKLKKLIGIESDMKLWLKLILSAIIFIFIANYLRYLLVLNQYLEAVICITAGGIFYLALCYIFKLFKIKEIIFFIGNILKK